MFFACASQEANLHVFGSASEGYKAVVLVATVGSTSYHLGSSPSAPANDAPAGAIPLTAAKESTVNTAGASGARYPWECMADPEARPG